MAAVPQVVERQLTDIELNSGLDQSTSQFALDWTKSFKALDNVDLGTPGVLRSRPGLVSPPGAEKSSYAFNAGATNNISSILRLLSTSNGILALKTPQSPINSPTYQPDSFRAFAFDESGGTSSGMWSYKSQAPEFSVTTQFVAGIHKFNSASSPKIVGAVYTTYYAAVLVNTYSLNILYVVDRASGNLVKSVTYTEHGGEAVMTAVGDYLHIYIGNAGGCWLYQEDLSSQTNLSLSRNTATALSTGTTPVACVYDPTTTTSVVLTSAGRLARFNTSAVETANVNVAALGGFANWYDLDTDELTGDFWYSGDTGANFGYVRVNSAFALVGVSTVAGTGTTLIGIAKGNSTVTDVLIRSRAVAGLQTATVYTTGGATPWANVARVGAITSPFYNKKTGQFYAVMSEMASNSDAVNGASVLCCLSSYTNHVGCQVTGAIPYFAPLHAAAVCDAYTDWAPLDSTTGVIRQQKLWSGDGGLTTIYASLVKTIDGGYAIELRTFKLCDSTAVGCSYEAISGGITSCYDGKFVSEYGFLAKPFVSVAASAGVGIAAGSYNYVAVVEHIDGNGNTHISKCSDPVNFAPGGATQATITVTAPFSSNHGATLAYDSLGSAGEQMDTRIAVYRTTSGGTQYYRVGYGNFVPGATTGAIVDDLSDATLSANALLHRHPGTTGTSLDRYYAPASSCVTRHKDRVFCARGTTVFYSSFYVQGEAPWFNPAFSFDVPGGAGPITALASMEDMLVIFKRNAIFVVTGDGPPENGGNGTEFSPPRKLMTDAGCVDQRTLVSTNQGLIYRSPFTIERLDRRLTIEPIGQKVQDTLNANTKNGGSAFDPNSARAVWVIGATSGTYPGQLDSTTAGTAVVYDLSSDAWCTYTFTTSAGAGKAMQDVVSHETGCSAASIASRQRLVFADSARIYLENGYKDTVGSTDYFIPVSMETGWVRSGSRQDRIRVSDLLIAALRNADCNLNVYYAANYSQSYTLIKQWTPTTWGTAGIVQLEAQAPKEAVQSMSFKLTTSDPTPTSFGSGQQFDIFGLTVKAGLRGAGAKLASGNKG